MRPLVVVLVLVLVLDAARPATAGPPSYLLLRPVESSGPRHHHGQPAAAYYDVRTEGYAYGYFGIHDRAHWSHSFGVLRTHHQWSRW